MQELWVIIIGRQMISLLIHQISVNVNSQLHKYPYQSSTKYQTLLNLQSQKTETTQKKKQRPKNGQRYGGWY